MHLITPQTSKEGKLVRKVLVAQDVYYPGENEPKEYYMSVLTDREIGRNIIVYSTEGGMDIESVADKTPHLIHKEEVDPLTGLLPFQARRIAFNLGLSGVAFKGMVKFVSSLYKAFVNTDASMFEINPVLKTSDDKIIAVVFVPVLINQFHVVSNTLSKSLLLFFIFYIYGFFNHSVRLFGHQLACSSRTLSTRVP